MFSVPILAVVICLTVDAWALTKLKLSDNGLSPGMYWNALAIQIPLIVLAPLVGYYGFGGYLPDYSYGGVNSETFDQGSIWVIYAVLTLCITLVVCDKALGKAPAPRVADMDGVVIVVIIMAISVNMLIIWAYAKTLPIMHLGDIDVRELRYDVTTGADFPPYFASTVAYLSYFGMAYAAMITRTNKFLRITLIAICCIGLLWTGEKSPIVRGVFTYYFAAHFFRRSRVSAGTLISTVIIAIIAIVLLWAMYTLTLPVAEAETIQRAIIDRLFYGQMAGYYQALSVTHAPNLDYAINWIPFAGSFGADTTAYARTLMVRLHGDNGINGYMNSLFLQDAWATLGYTGLIVSPIVVGASIIASLRILFASLKRVAGYRYMVAAGFALMSQMSITGGFSQFPLLKGTWVAIILFFLIALTCRVLPRRRTMTQHDEAITCTAWADQ